MNPGVASLRYRTNVLVLTAVFVVGGLVAYSQMGRLEDPEFTLKQAQVITPYPGASAEAVEQEVTEVIERAVQQMGQLDYVKSTSRRGVSTVDVVIKDTYNKDTLPQVWDELRRKVQDTAKNLPPGAGPSIVYDDFGDVYGIFFAITGDGYSLTELRDVAKLIQRELLTVDQVAKVSLVGVQPEVVYVELSPVKMAQFGLAREQIYAALQSRNLTVDAGEAQVGDLRISLNPTGKFESVEQFEDLLIASAPSTEGGSRYVYLRDIARVSRQLKEPASFKLRVNGEPAIGISISTVQGGNVVVMGNALLARMEQLHGERLIPFGVQYHEISIQSKAVEEAIGGFVNSLFQAVVIVIVVLLLFMGLRSGLIIGAVLLLTIIGSFIFMYGMGIMLQRISLGALIIALGMLVDNAIVVTEGMLIRIQRGEDKTEAARQVVGQSAIPLLGATVVAILAFAAIGASNDSTGEYCGSLFQVILISLLFSWVTAVTVTPLLCALFLKAKKGGDAEKDAYGGAFYQRYRGLLITALRHRVLVVSVLVALLALSVFGFGFIESSFFPASTRAQFMVDFWLPEGTRLSATEVEASEVEKALLEFEEITAIASFIGQGPPRYLLTLSPETSNSAYAHFLVSVKDYRAIDGLLLTVQRKLEQRFPESIPQCYKFALGPGDANKIQVRIQGSDRMELRRLARQVTGIMQEDGGLIGIQSDWRDMVLEYRPVLKDAQARQLGIDRPQVANLLKETFDGRTVGIYQEGDEMLPIMVRAPQSERWNLGFMDSLTLQSPATGQNVPMSQIVSDYETVPVNSIIKRRDRVPTITIKSNPREEIPSVALARLMPRIDAIEIPQGYRLVYGGEYEDSRKAQGSLAVNAAICGILMVVIVILMFNALRQPLIIWICVPLALIGVTAGLLVTNQPFGFMSLLGLLSLSGMLIKNATVLIDEIETQRSLGTGLLDSIIDSGVSRMRPVLMAAATTVLGMIPLLLDAFFAAMAVTIMAGLTFATVLTLIVVPVLYAMLFRAPKP